MRHSRKAVMKEHYMLYMKKHIFNGKYFVRNMQVGAELLLVLLLVIGAAMIGHKPENGTDESTEVSVKDALFGTSEEEQTTVEAKALDYTEAVTTEGITASIEKVVEQTVAAQSVEKQPASDEVEEKKETKQNKFSDRCIANVEETLNIRQEPDAESDFVGSMNPGAIAKVLGTEGEWTRIKSGDVEGYVLSDYVLTGEEAEEFSASYVTLCGNVLEDGVNVRKEASTDADIIQVLNKDDTVSVIELPEEETEEVKAQADSDAGEETVSILAGVERQIEVEAETEEEITWLPVMLEDGQTGYVSAELLEIDELYELAVSAEELERIAKEEEAARRAAEEEAARQAAAAAAPANTTTGGGSKTDNSDSYQGAVTTPVTATESGECIGTFTITAYCGCSKCSGGNNKTASGTTPTEGRTIAADTSILPYGTQVVIDGIVYTVEDCGSGVVGNHIDIFFSTHEKAKAYGRRTIKVYKY